MKRNAILLLFGLFANTDGSRIATGASLEQKEEVGFGCDVAKTCVQCLTTKPVFDNSIPILGAGKYCKWCPHHLWSGPENQAGGEGTCRPAVHTDRDCRVWYFPITGPTLASIRPHGEREDALLSCPGPAMHQSHEGKLDDESGGSLLKMRIQHPGELNAVLYKFGFELQRLMRFHFTNPTMFAKKFRNMDSVEHGAKSLWDIVKYGLDHNQQGQILNMMLGAVGGLSAHIREMLTREYRSQDKLVTQGRAASSGFFDDVSLGVLYDAYEEVLNLTLEETQAMVEAEAHSKLLDQEHALQSYKQASAEGHKALFVAGFFTGGATWFVSDIWTGADLVVEALTRPMVDKAIFKKVKILVGMFRLGYASLEMSPQQTCYITSSSEGERPCPDMVHKGVDSRGTCVRENPWGFRYGNGALGVEGRCYYLPKVLSTSFLDGAPCISHTQCGSSYCHFETKMQYFFSDHDRVYSDNGYPEAVPIITQLRSLNVIEATIPGEVPRETDARHTRPLEDFLGLFNSAEGAKYSTIGTCATPCPKSEAGTGACAALNSAGAKVDFEFGLHLPNRLMVSEEGAYQQVYGLIGQGACGDKAGLLSVVAEYGFGSVEDLASKECARKCADLRCAAFEVYPMLLTNEWKCHLHDRAAEIAVNASRGDALPGTCYGRELGWPLDAHQPWNQAWYFYVSDVSRVVALLEKSGSAQVLEQVQRAYPHFCRHGSKTPRCMEPRTWNRDTAIQMLTHDAPLSVKQTQILREKVDPDHGDAAFHNNREALLRDLFADEEWGKAWQNLFGPDVVEQVQNEDPSRRLAMQAKHAQQLQLIAKGHWLKAEEGLWDLAAAQEKYIDAAFEAHVA
eukprot:TRINITY_DN32456_c0_g2_i1.p1 TRINITY_DN32456_c0_g2~~TRINITY_DN32456_c0_g2_i1.p1  ORF type:complete len:864 (+),score=135.53 TRINITY_DN32456_c0_g2_i1:42-2594(+)